MIFTEVKTIKTNYDYHFIIREGSGENAEVYSIFSAIEKIIKRQDSNLQNKIHLQCKASSLSSLNDNLVKGPHKSKYKDFKSCPESMTVNDGLLVFSCADCNKNWKRVNEDLAKRFENRYRFCDRH